MTKKPQDESPQKLSEGNGTSGDRSKLLNFQSSSPDSVIDRPNFYQLPQGMNIVEIEGKLYAVQFSESNGTGTLVPLKASITPTTDANLSIEETVPPEEKTQLKDKPNRLLKQTGKKTLLATAGLAILLVFGLTYWISSRTAPTAETASTETTEPVTPARPVTITPVESTTVERTINASGTVAADEEVPVMSQATGLQVTEILADRGDYVSRGQTLARLNSKMLEAEMIEAQGAVAQAEARLDELRAGSRAEEIAQAEARVNNAQSAVVESVSDLDLITKRVERNQRLQAEGAIARDRLDEILNQERVAESNLEGAKARLAEAQQELAQLKSGARPQTIRQAEAELTQARGRLQLIAAQLEDTEIVAPVDGIIATRNAQVGQVTSNSESLFSIIENGKLELRLKVPETLIGQIDTDKKVRIISNVNPNLQILGKVKEIDPVIDDNSRLATVKIDLPGGTNLKPGMFLRANITTSASQGTIVPIEALLPQSDDRAIAFVVQDDNTVKSQLVDMGEIVADQKVEILQGLEIGDRVVLKGAAYLKDGDRIKII